VANGNWHTIVCVKSADGPSCTTVQVIVDGIAGPIFHSAPMGNVISNDPVDLGGQGPKATKDSIDGQYTLVSYVVS
jgi:hypothetical protein